MHSFALADSSLVFGPNEGHGALKGLKISECFEKYQLTSKETRLSACAKDLATCQKRLQACRQPDLLIFWNVYASKSGPPLGRTIIA